MAFCTIILAFCALYCSDLNVVKREYKEVVNVKCPKWNLILDEQMRRNISWRSIPAKFVTVQVSVPYTVNNQIRYSVIVAMLTKWGQSVKLSL